VTCPHPHVQLIIWYSVTVSAAGGISKTCTLEAIRPAAPARSAPHLPQKPGSMTRVSSGRAAICRPAPGWPFWPPCGRPARARRLPALAFAPDAGLSWLGGCEEFEESRPACRRSAVTSARSDSISAACSATTAVNSATRAVSSAFPAASSSYDGCSGCGIPEPNHDHKPGTSTDTPQINRGPDWLRSNHRPSAFQATSDLGTDGRYAGQLMRSGPPASVDMRGDCHPLGHPSR
jgi:hypothetical protein